MDKSRVTVAFINLGHTFDHLAMLIFPTVVLAMTAAFGRSYAELLPLSLGGFIAFGAGSLPAGWLGDRWSRWGMMVVFFVGLGVATILTGLAQGPTQIALGLTLVGLFAAIYHPVGIAMLVKDTTRVGRTLGVNGVYGNLGVAFAALIAGALAQWVGWRAAFILPGLVFVAGGIAFALLVPRQPSRHKTIAKRPMGHPSGVLRRVFIVLTIATSCGGIIFNATTIAMPKIFDERLTALVHTTFGIGALVCLVYVLAAMAQLLVGRLIDGRSLRSVFLPLSALQVPLLFIGGILQNWLMLMAAFAMMFVVFGMIPINDAMVARYTDDAWRSRVYAVRYVVSFGASSLAVPLVAYIRGTTGGFGMMFTVLAAIALLSFAAALAFPENRAEIAPAAQPAE